MINSSDLVFKAQTELEVKPPVYINYGGTDIHTITGPVPMVDIATSFNYTDNGELETTVQTITLTGKIFKIKGTGTDVNGQQQPSGGTTALIQAASGLSNLFTNCSFGNFTIMCGGANVVPTATYQASGVKVTSFNIDKTEDRWMKTMDYTAVLEYTLPGTGNSSGPTGDAAWVINRSDVWNFEPLDDVTLFTKFNLNPSSMGEWSNPQMMPTAPTVSSRIPATIFGGGGLATAAPNPLQVLNVPQFKITRKLSAKGIPKPSGVVSSSGTLCPTPGQKSLPFLHAKAWVQAKHHSAFSGGKIMDTGGAPQKDGSPFLLTLASLTDSSLPTAFTASNMFLYNHTRSINIDVYSSTYETNDSWLAMPTGTLFTESYTVETSTSDAFIKTVTVAGTIQGLSVVPLGIMTGASGLQPTGTPGTGLGLGFSPTLISGASFTPSPALTIPDVPDNQLSKNKLFHGSKYENALSGWLYDIKPYLYRRASITMNSNDRSQDYVPIPPLNPIDPPNNPIYCKETLLNPTPIATTENHDTRKGTLSYSCQYNNMLKMISGTISENITITNTSPSETVSETVVIGRAMGPILQKTGSTATKKTIAIELVVKPPTGIASSFVQFSGCPLFTGGYIYTTLNTLIDGVKPFGLYPVPTNAATLFDSAFLTQKALNQAGIVFKTSDTDSWSPTSGRYSRTVEWIYQQCNIDKYYLDH